VRIVVLASGRGSNFAALADAIARGELPNAQIVGLVCNRPEAPALDLARTRKIPATVLDSKSFGKGKRFDRPAYEEALVSAVERLEPELICLAGYMLLLGKAMLEKWTSRIVNIHPSLLPSFPGLAAQKQALEYGVRWTGCTVHFVDEHLDAGPFVAQETLEILDEDTDDTLSARLLPIEHRTYVKAVRRLCNERYEIVGRRVKWLGPR
jgi:phosphoribosylglycinamide formyltransferase-1